MIKKLSFVLLATLSFPLFSQNTDKIQEYRYYQIDKDLPNGKGPFYAIYIMKNDPCIFIDDYRKNSTLKLCEMADSGLNLERDSPSIYPVEMKYFAGTFSFIVAAPWNEQECNISFPKLILTCEPTGKN